MTDEAIAVLFSVDPDTNDASWDIFRESENDRIDPISRAEGLMISCKPDFPPTRLWVFTGNDRARELRSEHLLKEWGIVDA